MATPPVIILYRIRSCTQLKSLWLTYVRVDGASSPPLTRWAWFHLHLQVSRLELGRGWLIYPLCGYNWSPGGEPLYPDTIQCGEW